MVVIPDSDHTVRVNGCRSETFSFYDFAFLIENERLGKKVMFDLGTRKDYWNLAPAVQRVFGIDSVMTVKQLKIHWSEDSGEMGSSGTMGSSSTGPPIGAVSLSGYTFGSIDPFDSYPPTRLPREQIQRLIYSFHHKIAFQYYPLDLEATSNPFLISWWPLALGDPALFHVSLQTACLDEERAAQKGFRSSEILMADSVTLLRRKIEDTSLAVQDGTMNSVITLATIEFGKGNHEISQMHIEGVKRLVTLRGGINSVRQTSPLTARMITWVSMLIMGHPQFGTQDDFGIGDGIPPIPEWQIEPTFVYNDLDENLDMEGGDEVMNVFVRLRSVFQRANRGPFPNTQLHDLTCFVVHRLLISTAGASISELSPTAECIRYAIILYLFIVQGPIYYPHEVMVNVMVAKLIENLEQRSHKSHEPASLDFWLIAVGMVASTGTSQYEWLSKQATTIAGSLHIESAQEVLDRIKSVLWLDKPQSEYMFSVQCEGFLTSQSRLNSPDLQTTVQPSDIMTEFL
ncbi:hypothetical protein N7481_009179 [Penicillium waksmanii]|uniref:uncharacterized protein n=1 Tax=Penicillium waksmanii TaxID=69791 RepID=UPI0025495DB4|nr:uncharacterized protein N7481_009179 [Penicillium waksmanii]KAJ5975472.1 hypothetical protein N7481_009179 [Penicillium waksmanii]